MTTKKLFILFVLLLSFGFVKAQTIYAPGGTVGSSTNTNVGIGTSSPIDLLTVNNGNMLVRRNDAADAIIGAVHNSQSGYGFARLFLMIYEGVGGHPYTEYRIQKTNNAGTASSWTTGVNNADEDKFVINCGLNSVTSPSLGSNYLTITTAGLVGIGTSSPKNKLDVKGTIHAQEIKVDMTGWSDFVFNPKYQLKPLSEVESFIKANGHLEDIPSAMEVEKEGVNIGNMQSKLLQKIEELTLYSIGQNKKIEELEKMNKCLIQKMEDLEKRITK